MHLRMYPSQPIFGVGGIVVSHRGVLLARRDKYPHEGLWSLPGGCVEVGETQTVALEREILEETGVQAQVLELVNSADIIFRDDDGRVKYHAVVNHYLVRACSLNTRPEYPSGEVNWFHPDHLPLNEMSAGVYDLLKRLRSKILILMARHGEEPVC